MHIVHCLTHSTLGGGQEVPFLLVKNLIVTRPDINHTVMLPKNGVFVERFQSLGVNVIPFPFDSIHPLSIFKFISLIASTQPDIIHSHGRGAGFYCRVLSKKYIPYCRIHTHHGFHRPDDRMRCLLFTMLERYLSRNTDCVVAVSHSEKEEIQQTIPASTLMEIIPNIVDCDDIRRRADERVESSDDHFSVAMIGREDPVKNHSLAFNIADIVMHNDRTISFTFIGINVSNNGVTGLQLKYPGRCDATGLLDNPLPLLRKKSVLLITSKREGAPISILEAMALGKPVVGTNVRGINDLKSEEANGILLGDSASSIAELILLLARNKELYTSLSTAARQWSASQCNIQRWVGDYLNMYSKVLLSC
jgi:glycosyltransferase involved in cell wall biosynthesis